MLTFGIWVVIQPSSHDANQVVKNLGTWYRHYHLTITNNHHHQQPPSPTTTITNHHHQQPPSPTTTITNNHHHYQSTWVFLLLRHSKSNFSTYIFLQLNIFLFIQFLISVLFALLNDCVLIGMYFDPDASMPKCFLLN
jgi:hypothetical protein